MGPVGIELTSAKWSESYIYHRITFGSVYVRLLTMFLLYIYMWCIKMDKNKIWWGNDIFILSYQTLQLTAKLSHEIQHLDNLVKIRYLGLHPRFLAFLATGVLQIVLWWISWCCELPPSTSAAPFMGSSHCRPWYQGVIITGNFKFSRQLNTYYLWEVQARRFFLFHFEHIWQCNVNPISSKRVGRGQRQGV